MTGRERLHNIINKVPVDRISWTTLVDDVTRSVMPRPVRAMAPFDFYRHIGCDILQFGNYGLPKSLRMIPPCQLITPNIETNSYMTADGQQVTERKTDRGTLIAVSKNAHPVKYPVESLDELERLKDIWLNSYYQETPDMEESYERVDAEIGDSGIYVPTIDPSPIQQLIEFEMGIANFYYLLQDYPKEMAELFEVMHACRLREYRIFASRIRSEAIILTENTSSTLTSPSVYAKYSLPQIRDYVEAIHQCGKKTILHMCGLLEDLLPLIKETGLDGINGLTPPPFGDTRFEDALDMFGEDFVILGGVFNEEVFQKAQVSSEEIKAALDEIFTPRIRKANLVLWLVADGLPTSLERFQAVQEWMMEIGEK